MKEYEYSIIRRVSRNPKRNREGRGVSQSDLEALRQELSGDQNATVTAVRDDLELVDIASEDMRNRLETAEQALTGKLDSGAFAQWQAGDYAKRQSSLDEELRKKLGSGDFDKWKAVELAKALAGKASTVDVEQSARDAIAEAIKQAGEMDKQIKVGGRNLIVKDSYDPEPAETTESYLYRRLILSRKHTFVTGDWYTLSMDVQVPEDAKGLDAYNIFDWSGAVNKYGRRGETRIIIHNGRNHITFRWGEAGAKLSNHGLLLYRGFGYNERPQDNPRYLITTSNITLVKGTIGLESYVPAPEDVAESVTALESKLLDTDQGEISKLKKLLGKHSESFEELETHPLTIDDNGFWRIWSVKDGEYKTTQYKSRGEKGEDAGRYLGRAKRIRPNRFGNYMLETETGWRTAKKGDYVYLVGDAPNRGGDKDTYYIVRELKDNTVWEVYNIKGHTPRLTLDEQFHLLADGEMVSMQSLKGRDGEDGAKGDKGDTPNLSLDEQYRLVADGKLVSQQSLKGRDGEDGKDGERGADGKDGHTPHIDWNGTKLVIDNMAPVDLRGEAGHSPKLHIGPDDYLYIDGAKQRYLRGPQGEAGHSPSAEEVLNTEDFKERLEHRVKQQVAPVTNRLKTAQESIVELNKRSLTLQQKEDLGYLTTALRLKMAGGEGDKKTLEGLALQRYIALSRDNKTVTAYLASDALDAVLKAGITGFGTPDEREQVAIYHNGTGHLGNLHFAGNQIDFKTGRDDAPYLSIGAEESQFIDNFIGTARLTDTPVSVGTVTLSERSTVYERTVSVDNSGTRLTVTIDELEVAVYETVKVRLLLDNDVLDTWMGITSFREGGGGVLNGVPDIRAEHTPYKGSNLSYERVVRAGSHTLRLEIAGNMDSKDSGATVKGLRVRRRYDTGAQQSALTKSGLRLFGSPDRYFDVDYRDTYTSYLRPLGYVVFDNPYLVRIKGGAKVDKLTVDELDMPGVPLCGASFDENGTQIKAFGKYVNQRGTNRAQAVYYDNGRFFRVYHSIGHTRYLPTVQVIGDTGNDINWSLAARIYAVNANDFAVRIITNGDNPIRHAFSFVAFKTM